MYISLSAVGVSVGDINARIGASNAHFHMIDVEELFENVVTEADMVRRLETRVKAFARLMGVEVDYVEFDEVSYEDHDITPTGDAIDRAADAAKLYDWLTGLMGDWDYLPMFARLHNDGWKYVNFDNLRGEAEEFFTSYEEGDEEQLAQDMVDDGLIEGPGEGWDFYVDWEAKGEDIARDYTSYDYEGTTYLFHY